MVINYDKTKDMILAAYQKYHTLLIKEIIICIKNKILENVKAEKLLGIVIYLMISMVKRVFW